MKRSCIMLLICVFISPHFIGCNLFKPKTKNWKPVTPQKKAVVHVVKYDGETLDIISKWYTGDTLNKNKLAESNPSISLSELLPGDKIFIPNEILKTREAMPKEFIATYVSKQKKIDRSKASSSTSKKTTLEKKGKVPAKERKNNLKPKIKPAPPAEEEFELIGPK